MYFILFLILELEFYWYVQFYIAQYIYYIISPMPCLNLLNKKYVQLRKGEMFTKEQQNTCDWICNEEL